MQRVNLLTIHKKESILYQDTIIQYKISYYENLMDEKDGENTRYIGSCRMDYCDFAGEKKFLKSRFFEEKSCFSSLKMINIKITSRIFDKRTQILLEKLTNFIALYYNNTNE